MESMIATLDGLAQLSSPSIDAIIDRNEIDAYN